MMNKGQSRQARAVLKFLAAGERADVSALGGAEDMFLMEAGSRSQLVKPAVLDALYKAGLVDLTNGSVRLREEGRAHLQRSEVDDQPFAHQHRKLARENTTDRDGDVMPVLVNRNESPLSRLANRRDRGGRPWLDATHVEAGERLRRDFTLGGLMQKVTSNWDFSAIGTSRGGAGGKADLTDSALDARRRLDHAMDVVGPELGGLVTDVCCFLKGLEHVERERRWPPRSAKLMLRTALDLLARHYGTKPGRRSPA